MSNDTKSVLAPSIAEGFKGLADQVSGHVRSDRTKWSGFRSEFAKLTADFPRLDNGAIDRESEVCEEARQVFMAQARLALTSGSEYDRPLHKAGDDEFHIPTKERPANFTLTGRNAVSMDKATLTKMPSLTDNPMGIRRFVESTKKTVDNTGAKAWGRFFEADFVAKTGGRGASTDIADWIDGLATPMVAKLGKARTDGRKVATNDAAKKALAQFRKALLG